MENFIVSARKYRPATFHQVVGQESITSTLQNAIKKNHLAQAFLFTGPRGIGKTTCARILAKTINCENLTSELEPCDKCESCTSFNNNASFNIHELDAASNNSVDDIRNLVEQVRIPPQVGKYKVYIIDEVHMLSQAAFNAFLKTLEEPPAYAKFILATTEKHKILPTILSRCQIFDFKRISIEDIANYLGYVAGKENINTEIEALHIIAQKADGALRDALSTFDQIVSYSGNTLSYKSVIENLNILDYEYYFKVTDFIVDNDIPNLLLIFNEIIENGFDGQHFIVGLSEHLRSLLVLKNPATVQLLHASGQLKERYIDQAGICSPDFLISSLNICNKYDLSYKGSSNKRLHIEIALLELCNITQNKTDNYPNVKKNVEYGAKSKEVSTPIIEKKQEYISKKREIESSTIEQDKTETKPVNKTTDLKTESTLKNKAPKEKGNGRTIKNISIKQGLQSLKNRSKDTEEQPEEKIINEFTQEKLNNVWDMFTASYMKTSPSFSNAIAKYKPVLRNDFLIEYKVDSMIISQDLLSVTSLLEFLKEELKNNQIKLKAVAPEKSKKKTAYTDREKFAEMTKKYPGILKLKDQLNLEIDF